MSVNNALLLCSVFILSMAMASIARWVGKIRKWDESTLFSLTALNIIFAECATVTSTWAIVLITNVQLNFVDLFWIMGILAALTITLSSPTNKLWRITGIIPASGLVYLFAKTMPVIESAMVLNRSNYIRVAAGYSIILAISAGLIVVFVIAVFSKYEKKKLTN